MSNFLNTPKTPWVELRSVVTAEDTELANRAFSTWPSTGTLDLRNNEKLKNSNGCMIIFFGDTAADPDNDTATYRLYGRCSANGPIIKLLTGVVTLGTLNITKHPITGVADATSLWADTITATGGLISSVTTIFNAGNNQICALKLDHSIFKELYMEYDDILDTGEMDEITALICGY